MGQHTAISWTDHTFNPWWGCLKVSPGCANCYAEHLAVKRRHMPVWGPAATTRRAMMSDNHWKEPLRWFRKAVQDGVRRRVFCASMADVFEDHPDVVEARRRLWELIEATSGPNNGGPHWNQPGLDWLLLTKRPENIERMLPDEWLMPRFHSYHEMGIPSSVWIGTSAESQDEFDRRWPVLETFGRIHHPRMLFLSLEPLLGPINLQGAIEEIDLGDEDHACWTRSVDWVIVGGESGTNARPMDGRWASDIRDQCLNAEIPFFFKQMGGTKKIGGVAGGDRLDDQVWHQWPGDDREPVTAPENLVDQPPDPKIEQMRLL